MRDAEEGDSACMPRVKQGRKGEKRERGEERELNRKDEGREGGKEREKENIFEKNTFIFAYVRIL